MSILKKSVQEHERINSIDVMRGFAILGIFLMNMLDFHSPMLYIDPYKWWRSTTDKTIYSLINFFVQASFYPLFAMLFGFGLMTMRLRAADRGISFTPIAIRRLSMLLIIGCLHAFLIWHGDILITYAIFGFFALFFLKWSGKSLLSFGILIYTIPNLLISLLNLIAILFSPITIHTYLDDARKAVDAYQNGSFLEVTAQRLNDWSMVNNLASFYSMFFAIFPLFIIGAGIAKLNVVKNEIGNKKQFKKMLFVFLILGSLIKSLPFVSRNLFSESLLDIFGGPLLAVSYSLIIILLMEKHSEKLKLFQSVGKLSLSNYLFQSTVSTFLFYSYGFGLYNKVSVGMGTILVLVIFIFQAYISMIWVKRYHYGPVEWVWRAFSYMKKPRWKK
ncbi:MAG TPA: DUF418 domain-containing protein [Pseudoneobacillus sp.]|nr:DUF418 domain-containing protein [Pseudoneobacillus sp.]